MYATVRRGKVRWGTLRYGSAVPRPPVLATIRAMVSRITEDFDQGG